jgi:predicted kinase
MKKFIVIIDGPMGSGKSTVGELLVKKFKRTALVNEDKIKWFISDFRRSIKDNSIVRAVLIQMCKEYLKQGISIIVAQGFLKGIRPLTPYIAMAKKNKARFIIYHLDAPKEVLLERIDERRKTRISDKKPIAASRIHRNIRRWKANRYVIGKEFKTEKISAKTIASGIFKEVTSMVR